MLSQLGQDLQSGDVASAQKAYSTLQQDLQQYDREWGARWYGLDDGERERVSG